MKNDKKKPSIYYAHPWAMRGSDEEKYHMKILEEKGFDVYDPFLREEEIEKKYGGPYYSRPSKDFAIELVEKDFGAILKCKYFIAIMRGSTGTAMELMYAKMNGKRILVIDDRNHPFSVALADELYETFDEFEKKFKLNDKGEK
ncbi:MAG: hypothetical protein ACTSQ8_23875 [Candidatus Helarchaeota archaeon]